MKLTGKHLYCPENVPPTSPPKKPPNILPLNELLPARYPALLRWYDYIIDNRRFHSVGMQNAVYTDGEKVLHANVLGIASSAAILDLGLGSLTHP